ncbi:MAG: hypothetical protein HS108_06205 [Planctomycetes bacterium]|jgi:hypothetical protein|nr:hypothetical protein [Planctomycetota bacterium]MCL4731531.1 hypothetical protein [Planctomycetota bacterium]
MRKSHLFFAAAMLALGAASLGAQAARPDLPPNRVRLVRPANHAPEPYYHQNRVMLRHIEINAVGAGMQISGDVYTDFECDAAPAALKLPSGQIMGLKVDVQLYSLPLVLKRNARGVVESPRIEVRNFGRPVEGQSAQVRVDRVQDGFGLAAFSLPAMSKPLAPGIYQLAVSVVFQTQEAQQREQIKWCSNFWGEEDEGEDPITNTRVTHRVLGDKAKHDYYFKEVLEVLRKVDSVALIYMADTLGRAGPILRSPFLANDRTPATYMIWDDLMRIVGDIEDLEAQYPMIDKDLADFEANEARIEARLKDLQRRNPRATRADVIKLERDAAKAAKKRVDDLILMSGGKATKDESRARATCIAARGVVLEQIKQFQEWLTLRYWQLVDGYLLYAGWHPVNKPGYNAYNAVVTKDNRKDADDRQAKLDALRKLPNGEEEAKRKRAEAWKFFPADVQKVAFGYLDTANEKADFDSRNFTKKVGQDIVLDLDKWSAYRTKWRESFTKATDPIFNDIDTSVQYANQVWPEMLAEARAAREEAICNAYAWEFHTRTQGQKEPVTVITEEWKALGQSDPSLVPILDKSKVAPGSIWTRFSGRLSTIKDTLSMPDFISAYRRGIEAGAQTLPGTRPVPR